MPVRCVFAANYLTMHGTGMMTGKRPANIAAVSVGSRTERWLWGGVSATPMTPRHHENAKREILIAVRGFHVGYARRQGCGGDWCVLWHERGSCEAGQTIVCQARLSCRSFEYSHCIRCTAMGWVAKPHLTNSEPIAVHWAGADGRANAKLRRLDGRDLAGIEMHLLDLDLVSRNRRFRSGFGDAAVAAYVRRLDLTTDILFGAIEEDSGRIVGLAEAHPAGTAQLLKSAHRSLPATAGAASRASWSRVLSLPPWREERRGRTAVRPDQCRRSPHRGRTGRQPLRTGSCSPASDGSRIRVFAV